MKEIGVTIVIIKEKNSNVEAIKVSFVFQESNLHSLLDAVYLKAKEQIEKYYIGYKYLGIDDIFIVKTENGGLERSFLGRSSLYDLKDKTEGEKICDNNLLLNKINSSNLFNVSLVYFHDDKEGEEHDFVFTVLTVLKLGETNLKSFATSKVWLNNIIQMSVDQLYLEGLTFLGLEYMYEIKREGFCELSNNSISIHELEKDILNKKAVEIAYNLCLEDFKYMEVGNG